MQSFASIKYLIVYYRGEAIYVITFVLNSTKIYVYEQGDQARSFSSPCPYAHKDQLIVFDTCFPSMFAFKPSSLFQKIKG